LTELLERIDAYLDAVPLSAADPEPVGKFTLFRPRGAWKYYGRPRLGLAEEITVEDVDQLRQRQRELELPENIEWVVQLAPSLGAAATMSGLAVVEYPLLVLEAAMAAQPLPQDVVVRVVGADEPDFARAHAVANVGFGAGGTAVGPEGAIERDESAAAMKPQVAEFMRERARRALSITYAAFDGSGPICVGTHQPVGDVTEIVGVATLPTARRRGLAAAVTAALVADALERGATTVFLSAGSDDVARVYEKVGFVRIGAAGSAEPAATGSPAH
jgi:ribosomal protein S18 acetylase RimI-like enzyme